MKFVSSEREKQRFKKWKSNLPHRFREESALFYPLKGKAVSLESETQVVSFATQPAALKVEVGEIPLLKGIAYIYLNLT